MFIVTKPAWLDGWSKYGFLSVNSVDLVGKLVFISSVGAHGETSLLSNANNVLQPLIASC